MNETKNVVLAYVDACNRGDVECLCKLFTPDAEIWGVLGAGSIEQARPVWKDLMECLEMQLQVDGIVSEGNTVAVRFTERGKSARAFRGLGPTERTYEVTAMEWFEIKDGLIHRRWGARDFANISRQLGFST